MGRQYPVLKAWHIGDQELRKDYNVSVAEEVPTGQTISQVDWLVDPDEADGLQVIDNPDPLGTGQSIGFLVSQEAKPAQAYSITALVTTSTLKKFQVPLLLAGVDKTK